MKKSFKFESAYGSFAYVMTAGIEISEPVSAGAEYLILQGLANLCYRAAGSAVDKALGVKGNTPRYQKRGDVPYSLDNARSIEAAVETALDSLRKKESALQSVDLDFKVTGEYVPASGGASPRVRATLFVDSCIAGGMTAMCATMVGLPGETDRSKLIEAAHEKRIGIDPPKASKAVKAVEKPAEQNGEVNMGPEESEESGEE